MTKRLLFLASLYAVSAFAEPSAFDAGVIDSDNPYGLSESEKAIIENRKRSIANQKLIRKQSILIDRLQERIEGLSSVVDSLSSKMGETGQKLNQIGTQSSEEEKEQIRNLQSQIDELKRVSEENYKKIDSSLRKLTRLMGDNSIEKPKKKVIHKKEIKKKKISSTELLKTAIKAFRAKEFKKAESIFTKLATNNYKPAQTNFYLGEIAYHNKQYDDAIAFYKTSVGYYDKASYMPKLLLHTALSFKKLGEDDSAEQFFTTLIDTYPDSPEADIARKY